MKYRFFRYSGSKFNYTEIVNEVINKSNKRIYVEPFIGSGAILFNLEKEFDEYIINDIDRNIINIYKAFKNITYKEYLKRSKFLEENYGIFKAPVKDKELKEEAKTNYYNFRNWYNENHWGNDSIDEGIYCYFLANMAINSMLRFGPNGMNQSFGNRFYTMDEENFNHIHEVLQKTTIYNCDYKEVLEKYPDAVYFLDPPYFSQDSSYTGFSEEQFIEFLDLIKDKEYVYTDILNDYNNKIANKQLIRNMRSTSPSANKKGLTGNLEYIFSSFVLEKEKKDGIDEDEW